MMVANHGNCRAAMLAAGVAGLILVLFICVGCSTTRPHIAEVTAKRYDHKSTRPGMDYFVRWTPPTISMVKFEYRQLHTPNKVLEQRCTLMEQPFATFEVRGVAFTSGGPVTAWRVSLWTDDNTCVAEQKSALW